MWQRLELKPPPVCTLQLSLDSGEESAALKKIHMMLEKNSQSFDGYASLGSEAFLLQKLMTKNKWSFRSEKILHCVKELYRCLVKFFDTQPIALIKSLFDNFPSSVHIYSGATIYLPSRQMSEYCLVRLIGIAALLHVCMSRSVTCYQLAIGHIEIGMQIPTMMTYAATVSRLWVLCRSLKMQIVQLYQELLVIRDILKPTQVKWLSDDFQLPDSLENYLKEEFKDSDPVSSDYVTQDMLKGMDLKKSDLYNLTATDLNLSGLSIKSPLFKNEDVGETICRTENGEQSLQAKNNPLRAEGKGITPDAYEPFNVGNWTIRFKKCRSRQRLLYLLTKFRKRYNVRSKRLKNCIHTTEMLPDVEEIRSKKGKKKVNTQRSFILRTIKKLHQNWMKNGVLVEKDGKKVLLLYRAVTKYSNNKKKLNNKGKEPMKKTKKVMGNNEKQITKKSLGMKQKHLLKMALFEKLSDINGFLNLENEVKFREQFNLWGHIWKIDKQIVPLVQLILEKGKMKMKKKKEKKMEEKMDKIGIIQMTVRRLTKLEKIIYFTRSKYLQEEKEITRRKIKKEEKAKMKLKKKMKKMDEGKSNMTVTRTYFTRSKSLERKKEGNQLQPKSSGNNSRKNQKNVSKNNISMKRSKKESVIKAVSNTIGSASVQQNQQYPKQTQRPKMTNYKNKNDRKANKVKNSKKSTKNKDSVNSKQKNKKKRRIA